jgi:hypothetical protein
MTSPPTADPRLLIARLQGEWDRLARSPECLAVARCWGLVNGELRSLDELLVASGLGRRGHRADERDVLAELVRRAATERLAGRVVLQRLLPGLAAIARRRSGYFTGQLAAMSELVGAAWEVICTFDLDRPRPYLVNGLLRACRYRAFAAPRDRRHGAIPQPPQTFDVPIEPAEEDEALLLLAATVREARRNGLDERDAEFLAWLASGRYVELAEELEVTPRTVRNHRDVVVHRVRRLVIAAA